MSAIVLNLLNSIPVQSWTFNQEEIVRIGRATDNNAILYSAVVSRHHAELRWTEADGWMLANMSPNGTYIDGEAIKTVSVSDGTVIRLATSGPRIQIKVTHAKLDGISPTE
jgi:pSer/pThr/pTyr-binding forkhead associated (FHA) protein